MKSYKNIFYAQWFVQMSLAEEVLVVHSWAARWALGGTSHLHTRGCTLTALQHAKPLSPPQEVTGMLKSIKYLLSAHNCEGKTPFRSQCPSNYSCKDHPSAVPEPGCLRLGVGVQQALTSQAVRRRRRRRSWGLLKQWCRARRH